MSKLPIEYKFLDLSDYGRFIARAIADFFKNTSVTPVEMTTCFIISGLFAIVCIVNQWVYAAAFFLIFKSILDAADGELARVKNTPSYTGRYYDSIADIILNFLFLLAFWRISDLSILYVIGAFIAIQMQGTLYNYYYVILRNSVNGDKTSRVFEDTAPTAMPGEKQETVTRLYTIFNFLYIVFDKTIYHLDKDAVKSKPFPNWFMTGVSSLGLGFQLLIMSIMLVLGLGKYVLPFFIVYSVVMLFFIVVRRFFLGGLALHS